MAASVTSLKKLMALGARYHVDKEEDFAACAKTFAQEAQLIAQMRAQLKADGLTVNKEYVKGRQNVTAHPLIAEIPKHVDCANRLLANMANIIAVRGEMPEQAEDDLAGFRVNA